MFDDDDDMLIEASLGPTADDSVSGDGFQPKKSTQAIVDEDDDNDDDRGNGDLLVVESVVD